ncbi:Metallo-dependent phosphatase-like protein [Hyaloraphidium curvatum]|nr:Metallo-dependent phosphatase-like protein [Hyaloraphidium curvatum]
MAPLRIAVFGDPQIGLAGANKDAERFLRAVKRVNAMGVQAAVICGDLTQSQEDYQVAKYRRVEAMLECQVFRVPGNHDIWNHATHRKFLRDHGMESTWSAAEIGGCVLVLLDTVVLNASPESGLLAEKAQEWAWLERTLAEHEGKRVLAFGHHPPWSTDPDEDGRGPPPDPKLLATLPPHWAGMFHSDDFRLECFRREERARFLALLEKHRVAAYHCGHTHTNDLWLRAGGVPSYAVAGTTMLVPDYDGSRNGIRILDLGEDGQLRNEFVEMAFEGELKPPYFPPGTVDILRKREEEERARKGKASASL